MAEAAPLIKPLEGQLTGQLRFDRLHMTVRRSVIEFALPLFRNWPFEFLYFCSRVRISMSDFDSLADQLPRWMNEAISQELGQPGRLITLVAVNDAIARLKERGELPNLSNVGRILRSKDAAVVREKFKRREQATFAELQTVIARLNSYIDSAAGSRASSRQIHARNALIVLLQIVTEGTLSFVINLSHRDVLAILRGPRFEAISKMSSNIASASYLQANQLYENRLRCAENPFFLGFRPGSSAARGARAALIFAMRGLDVRLKRSVEAFRGLLD